ncbi:hypothetical protein TruAng_002469 [Truncatella angustata]|nr:hypothetical protein TruAng_002469 [Truncatella angustata]
MGDAVGAVGTAAGLVSLGLQLYNGISTYLDALESRKDDLKSAQAQLTNLRRSLAVVDDVLPQLALIRGSAVDTVSSSLEQCKAELSQLDIFVQKLQACRLNSLDIGSKISEVKTDTDQIPELNSKVGQLLLEIHGLRTVVEDVTTEVNSTAAAIHASSTTVGHLQSGVEAFAPKVVSQWSTIRQGFDTVAQRNDVSEVKTIVKNNADVLKQITTAMDHLTGMTDSSLPNLAQMSSTLASMNRMLQGLSETERLLDVKDHWQPGHRRAAVSRLLAKPSQTKELLLQHVLCFTTEWSDAEASRVLQSALQTIMQIYKEKRSTPNDVDEFGKSILHLWVQTYSMAQSIQKTMQVGILDSFATELVRAGIPANIPDFNGRSPAMSLAANQFETYAIGTLRLLFEEAPELYFSSGNNFRYNGHAYFLKQHLLNDRTHAEIQPGVETNHVGVSRRLQLKRIALEVLNEREIQSYELSKETVLDRYTVDVIACLKNYGYEVTEFLGFGLYHQIHPEMPSVAASLYGRIASSFSGHKPAHIVANLLYELGFRDVDIADSSGYTPLMRSLHRPFQDIHLTLWLLDHGADPTTNFSTLDATARWNLGRRPYSWSRNSLLTAAHLILCCDDVWNSPVGHYSQSQDKEAFAALIMRVSSLDVLDCCGCCCTESGCSPASLLFLGLWRCFGSKNRTDSPQAIVSCVVDYFTKYSVDLTGHNSVCLSAFRMLTFEALGMTHTCCQGGAECKLSDNEITEVWDSESRLTDLLKTLQVEFAKSYPELGLSFVDFLTSQWAPRLERAVLELKNQKMSEDELATTLVLGVRWDNEELADTTVSSSSESESEDESDDIHYWIEELKKIAKNDPSARKW